MAKTSQPPIAITARLSAGEPARVIIELSNRSSETLSVVALWPYLVLELLDGTKQFVRGAIAEGTPPALPGKKDYRELRPRTSCTVELEVARTATDERDGSGEYALGALRFRGIPAKTKLRVTYQAEQLMPNMPRTGFYRGPANGEAERVLPG
jgi:hypothetical protein